MTPQEILVTALQQAIENLAAPIAIDVDIVSRIELVSRNIQNRAGVRLVLACALAKVHQPSVDIRKPYTEINTPDSYSGRAYDERYITEFIIAHNLPCNLTTAFLTPALRNIARTLSPDIDLVGRPREVYQAALLLLNDVYQNKISAFDLLQETIRVLIVVRDEKLARMQSLIGALQMSKNDLPLSAESIITLIQQHLSTRGSSRLPVLIIVAIYQVISNYLGERALPLKAHNAADKQTQALGDVEITLIDNEKIITVYEMKMKRVTLNDIDQALAKIQQSSQRIDNYIFITTDVIAEDVRHYASSIYDRTGGIEIVILDCIGFLRHFLHLFHRLRMQFLDTYQILVLDEPESAVSHPLKEAFLALRQAAESIDD